MCSYHRRHNGIRPTNSRQNVIYFLSILLFSIFHLSIFILSNSLPFPFPSSGDESFSSFPPCSLYYNITAAVITCFAMQIGMIQGLSIGPTTSYGCQIMTSPSSTIPTFLVTFPIICICRVLLFPLPHLLISHPVIRRRIRHWGDSGIIFGRNGGAIERAAIHGSFSHFLVFLERVPHTSSSILAYRSFSLQERSSSPLVSSSPNGRGDTRPIFPLPLLSHATLGSGCLRSR
mmetsp:Transcript_17114/g.31170  ORF Transcript_17114/g.31170 Transcript_17114/m.31170 type:complete len:232 (-) Transcript_17114:1672-2367(-)